MISPMPIMTSPQIKYNVAAQSTWLERLGFLAAQHPVWKTLAVWRSTVTWAQNDIQMQ